MTSPLDRRNIVVDVTVTSDTRGVNAVAKGLGDVDKSAQGAGDSLRDMTVDARALNAEIERTNRRIAELDSQLVQVGNDSVLRRELRGETSWLKQLEQIESRQGIAVTIGSAIGTRAGEGFGGAFSDTVGRTLTRGPVVAGIVAGLATQLPVLGGMLTGAITGAVGAGGIAGAIAMASKDERVRKAASEFGDAISAEFFSGGGAIAGSVTRSLDTLEDAFRDMEVPETFAKMADDIEVIAEGFGNFGRNIMPGINEAFDNMGPVTAAAAAGIGDLGTALGEFIRDASQSEGTAMGLKTAFDLLNGAIRLTGGGLELLSDAYAAYVRLAAGNFRVLENVADAMNVGPVQSWAHAVGEAYREMLGLTPGVGAAFRVVGTAVEEGARAVKGEAGAFEDLQDAIARVNEEMTDFASLSLSIAESRDRLEGAVDDFTEGLKENGRTFDANTEAGRRNRDNMRAMIEEAQRTRQATIELTGSTERANAEYQTSITRIEGMAAAAGVTTKELEDMAGDYRIMLRLDASMTAGAAAAVAAVRNMKSIISATQSRQLQEFQGGGVVQGPFGSPQLVVAHAGERVLTPQQQAMGLPHGGVMWAAPIVLHGGPVVDMAALRTEIAARGGQLAVLGLKAP